METVESTAQIIQFPDPRRWSMIARTYIDNLTLGDPRAAFFYLEYQLTALKLTGIPTVLKGEIEREYKRRGFQGPVYFGKPW
ncbi:hypothetical protein [Methylocaldum sp.]|uniref:hypothetical protein n=1 Tax=Methylocaldum sp. TaxID=1969727 RepID=UPI002D5DB7DE|nr:hypothetical protein [Methylocaldum sp.]HYE36363.1 hypothetical protein [Methylocaldum sp.]